MNLYANNNTLNINASIHHVSLYHGLASLGIKHLSQRFSSLINHYEGFEDYIDDNSKLPSSFLVQILDNLKSSSVIDQQTEFLNKASIMPCFFCRAINNGVLWNPLKESLKGFSQDKIDFWQDNSPYPSPIIVKKWLILPS